jgi:hypothetical protein
MNILSAAILGGALVIAGVLAGGRYTIVGSANSEAPPVAYIADRLTGSVRLCTPTFCRQLPPQNSN